MDRSFRAGEFEFITGRTPALGHDEVHVWRASQDLKTSRIQSLLQTLSVDERTRAERFYFQKDRDHFIIARGTLRAILGRYLKIEPSQLHFCYNLYGKPALVSESGDNELCFNISHSDGLALYALACKREIGIDLERMRDGLAHEKIAESFFSDREVAVLRALPTDLQQEAFYTCWTRKEAYVKARGQGLTLPLNKFDVSLTPGEPAALLSINGNSQEAFRWSLQEINPGPGYTATLAVEGHGWQLKCFQWINNLQKIHNSGNVS